MKKKINNRYFCKNIHRYFTDISDISDISVKSNYRYIRVYRYFDPCLAVVESALLRTEFERGVAQESLSMVGEACTKAEEENNRLTNKRLSLILDLGTIMDDFSAFREKAVADREAMEAEFDASNDVLFNYGYGCCVFTHNI